MGNSAVQIILAIVALQSPNYGEVSFIVPEFHGKSDVQAPLLVMPCIRGTIRGYINTPIGSKEVMSLMRDYSDYSWVQARSCILVQVGSITEMMTCTPTYINQSTMTICGCGQ